jgi:hypothetical protein
MDMGCPPGPKLTAYVSEQTTRQCPQAGPALLSRDWAEWRAEYASVECFSTRSRQRERPTTIDDS